MNDAECRDLLLLAEVLEEIVLPAIRALADGSEPAFVEDISLS
jgi:hypothetical protein